MSEDETPLVLPYFIAIINLKVIDYNIIHSVMVKVINYFSKKKK